MKKAACLVLFFMVFCMAGAGFAQGGPEKELKAQQEAQVRAAAQMTAAQQAYLAEAVVTQRESAGGRTFDTEYRASLVRTLSSLSVEALQAMQSNGGYSSDTAVPEDLGDSSADLVYTPVTPCRLFDTRPTPISANTQRNFYAAGTCGVPYGPATAVMINFVAIGPAGSGDLRVWPYGGSMPSASTINFIPYQNVANGIIQPICDPAASSCGAADITIRADSRTVNVVADVVGYFRKFRKEQVKSFNVVNRSGATTPIGTCTNYLSVTVNAPVAGKVIVRGNVQLRIAHSNGTEDLFMTNIGTTNTDCIVTNLLGYSAYTELPSALPTATYFPWLSPFRVFDVSAGSATYYLNANDYYSTDNGDFWYAGIEANFIPN